MNEGTGRHVCDTLMDVDTMINGARTGCWAHPMYWGKDEEWANCQPNAADMLEHYMSASGEDIDLDMDEFISDIPEFQDEIEGQQQDIIDSALEAAEGSDEPVTFPVSTEKIGWGYPPGEENGSEFVYDNRDWQSSIGSFHYWIEGDITVHPPDDPDGDPTYSLDTDVNMEKWYSWERDNDEQLFQSWKGMLAGQAHSDMAMLHQYGIAQEFWIRGDTSLPTVEG